MSDSISVVTNFAFNLRELPKLMKTERIVELMELYPIILDNFRAWAAEICIIFPYIKLHAFLLYSKKQNPNPKWEILRHPLRHRQQCERERDRP